MNYDVKMETRVVTLEFSYNETKNFLKYILGFINPVKATNPLVLLH